MTTNKLTTDDKSRRVLGELQPLVYPVFYNGQRLDQQLLNAHADADRHWGTYLCRLLSGIGILEGLAIEIDQCDQQDTVIVRRGAAMDAIGQMILVPDDYRIPQSDIVNASAKYGTELAVYVSFAVLPRYARTEGTDTPRGPLKELKHGFIISLSPGAAARKSTVDAPQAGFSAHAYTVRQRAVLSDDGVCLGVISTEGHDKGITITGVSSGGRSSSISSLEVISRYLLSSKRNARLSASISATCGFVGLPSSEIEISVLDGHDHPISNEALTVSIAANGLQAQLEQSSAWLDVSSTIQTTTDKDGKLRVRFVGESSGTYSAHVQVQFDSTQIATPPAVTIPVKIEHLLQADPQPVSGFCGEKVTLCVCMNGDLPEGAAVHFEDAVDTGYTEPANRSPDDTGCYTTQWRVRRVGSHTVRAVVSRVATSKSQPEVIDVIPIAVFGEVTRILVRDGNHQQCACTEELQHPIIIRVEKMDGTPVPNARVQISGHRFDVDMQEGIRCLGDSVEIEEGKRFGRTDHEGNLRFCWTPMNHGMQVLTVRHVATSKPRGQQEFPPISIADATVFARCEKKQSDQSDEHSDTSNTN